MIGLMIIAAFSAYGLITWQLARLGVRVARNRGWPGPVGGGTVVLGMYLLVFWDFIPTVVAHRYYCATQAGFEVHKTLEQWQAENPGVAETLVPVEGVIEVRRPNGVGYRLNQRFEWRVTRHPMFLTVKKEVEGIYDVVREQPLYELKDFTSGSGWFPADANTLQDYKFWMVYRSCRERGYDPGQSEAAQYKLALKKLSPREMPKDKIHN